MSGKAISSIGNHQPDLPGLIISLRLRLFQRWVQPAQQQGLRFPSKSPVRVLSIRWRLVSGFLADSIQQIHSLRASGVISSHAALVAGEEVRTFRKSAGALCTVPAEMPFLVMSPFYQFLTPKASDGGDGGEILY